MRAYAFFLRACKRVFCPSGKVAFLGHSLKLVAYRGPKSLEGFPQTVADQRLYALPALYNEVFRHSVRAVP